MITKVKKFTLKQKDFASGKLISPSREFWINCDCCGKLIVQGVELSNGHRIGNDCYEVLDRAKFEIRFKGNADGLFKMFGTSLVVQNYILNLTKV